MRHRKIRRHPKGASSHARAVLRNQSCSLVLHGQILTTTAMAKCLRPYVERIISKAVRANTAESTSKRVSIIRSIDAKLRNKKALDLLLNVVAKLFVARHGGYTRIMKAGYRSGDGAEMSVIQLVLDDAPVPPAAQDTGDDTATGRYDQLKSILLAFRTLNQRTVLKWAGYPFPEIPLKIARSDENHLTTLVNLPQVEAWDFDNWPTVAKRHAPLQLEIQFLADPRLLDGARVFTRTYPEDAKALHFSSIGADARAISFVVDARELTHATVIEVVHELPGVASATISVALVSPYSTLNRIRAFRI